MKNFYVRGVIAVIAATLWLGATAMAAEDGPMRQRIKERIKDRLEEQPAPEANAKVGEKITKPGDYLFKIEHGALPRYYRIHVPANYDPATPAPLLVSMHGGGGNMEYQADDGYYGQISSSEREGFIAVFPNGTSQFKSGKFATWNAGNCCGSARDDNVDDVGFIRQVVANIGAQMNIDRKRVYATGMSNGGLMAYRLACEAADVFKAIAPVAGTDNTKRCVPAHPVSVLHIHARNDMHVLFEGGAGPHTGDREAVTAFTSVPATVEKWAKLNGCPPTPARVLETQGAYCERYAPCKGNTEVQLCVTEGGGHSWPGAVKKPGIKGRDELPSQAIKANDAMWEFFRRHPGH
jgi:polyhydroxybutyrate depolymerase